MLPVVPSLLAEDGRVVALVKPQFEAGRDEVGAGGIVRDPSVHARVIETVAAQRASGRIDAPRRGAVAHHRRRRQPRVPDAPRPDDLMSTPPVKRVALIARLKLPQALEHARRGRRVARRARLDAGHRGRERAGRGLDARWPTAPRESLADGVDVVLAFGGDGTLLDAAGVVAHSGERRAARGRQPRTTRLPHRDRSVRADARRSTTWSTAGAASKRA